MGVLLDVRNLTTQFFTQAGVVHAVNGVSYQLQEGETLGIFEVWLLGIGLYLAPSEFQRFAQLIQERADTVRLLVNYVAASGREDEIYH